MKSKTKKLIITFVCAALAVTIGVVTIMALIKENADGSSQNTFAAGRIDCSVLSDGSENITIRNDGNAPAYIRASVVVNWKNASGQYVAFTPNRGFTAPGANWTAADSNSFYYYTAKVDPGATTTILVNAATLRNQNAAAPAGGVTREITVIAEAIQATATGYSSAWQFAGTNGTISAGARPSPDVDKSTAAPSEGQESDTTTTAPVCQHTYSPATCTSPAKCTLCGETSGGVLPHTEAAIPEIAATCTTAGQAGGTRCSMCNKVFTEPTVVPALGHNMVGSTCSRGCGYTIADVALDRTQSSPYEMYRACSCGYVDSTDGANIAGSFTLDAFNPTDDVDTNYKTQLLAGLVTASEPSTGYFSISGWVGINSSDYTLCWSIGSDDFRTWSYEVWQDDEVTSAAASQGYSHATRFRYTLPWVTFNSGEEIHLMVQDNTSGIIYCFAHFTIIKSGEKAQTVIGSIDNFLHQTTRSDYVTAAFKASPDKYTVTIAERDGLFDIRGWIATNLTDFSFVWRINEEYREGSVINETTEDAVQTAAVSKGYTTGQRFCYYFGPGLINSGDTIYLYTKDNTTNELYLFASYTIKFAKSASQFNLLNTMVAWDESYKGTAQTSGTSVDLWFDHLTEKRDRYDTPDATDLANTTYTIQMAKNEMEGCHFYLYSTTNKKIVIEYTPFVNASGNILDTELGVEYYIDEAAMALKGYYVGTYDLNNQKVIGVYPDAVVPYESYIKTAYGSDEPGSFGGLSYDDGEYVLIGPHTYTPSTYVLNNTSFSGRVNAPSIRGFVLQATTTKASAAGQYSATITVRDYDTNEPLKTATVYTYVYDVTLNEEPALDTYLGLHYTQYESINNNCGIDSGEALTALANFLLKYRITPCSTWILDSLGTEWAYNPRVTTIRVHDQTKYNQYKNDPILASKLVYYGQDEPGAPRNQYRQITFENGSTTSYFDQYGFLAMLGVAEEAKMLQNTWGWSDYRLIAPLERNPSFDTEDLKQYPSIDKSGTHNLSWATIYAALTSTEAQNFYNKYKTELETSEDMFDFLSNYLTVWVYTYIGSTPKIVSLNGCYYMQTEAHDSLYGEFYERMRKYQASGDEIWAYVACEPQWNTPYQNILLFNDGTEARTMFWTCYKLGQTGFLYWREDYYSNASNTNTYNLREPFSATGPGDGILVYPGGVYGQVDPIPSIRLINMRDGIEDYELLCMLEDYYNRMGPNSDAGYKGYSSARDKVMELVENVVTSTVTFSRDDDKIYDVHARLLQLLAGVIK